MTNSATLDTTEDESRTLDVTVYTKDNCQQCAATERALTRVGVDYREIKINEAVRFRNDQFYAGVFERIFSVRGLAGV